MTSVENLEFTEAFKNPLCAYVFVYVERMKKAFVCLRFLGL